MVAADTVILREGGAHFSVDASTGQHALPWVKLMIPLDGAQVFVDGTTPYWTRSPVLSAPLHPHQSAVRGAVWTLFFPADAHDIWAMAANAPISPVLSKVGEALLTLGRDIDVQTIGPVIDECVRLLGHGEQARRLDPRVAAVKEAVLDWSRSEDAQQFDIQQAADLVELSSSRLSHLFRAELGLPLKRFALFQRLIGAYAWRGRAAALKQAPTLATVAATRGFADQAHLARTARRFLGQPASYGGRIVTA